MWSDHIMCAPCCILIEFHSHLLSHYFNEMMCESYSFNGEVSLSQYCSVVPPYLLKEMYPTKKKLPETSPYVKREFPCWRQNSENTKKVFIFILAELRTLFDHGADLILTVITQKGLQEATKLESQEGNNKRHVHQDNFRLSQVIVINHRVKQGRFGLDVLKKSIRVSFFLST